MLQNFQFHFHCRVLSENALVKTQKPQPCYCPDGVMVKPRDFQAMSNESTGSNPTWANFFPTSFLTGNGIFSTCFVLHGCVTRFGKG